MHKDGGCCRDEVKVVKLKTSHVISQIAALDLSLPADQIIHTDFLLTSFRNYTQDFITVAHGPPISDQDVYLRNRVFRI